jgi:hypothetical protein
MASKSPAEKPGSFDYSNEPLREIASAGLVLSINLIWFAEPHALRIYLRRSL